MARAPDVCAGLLEHRAVLEREIRESGLLPALLAAGLLDAEQAAGVRAGRGEAAADALVAAAGGLDAARLADFCTVLERECPDLTAELLLGRTRIISNGYCDNTKDIMVMDYNLNRESPRSRRSVSQCSCNTGASRRSSAASSPPHPPPQLNNTVEMYVEPVVEDVSKYRSMSTGN